MRASLYSLYWDNIDPAIVTAQKEACAALEWPSINTASRD